MRKRDMEDVLLLASLWFAAVTFAEILSPRRRPMALPPYPLDPADLPEEDRAPTHPRWEDSTFVASLPPGLIQCRLCPVCGSVALWRSTDGAILCNEGVCDFAIYYPPEPVRREAA